MLRASPWIPCSGVLPRLVLSVWCSVVSHVVCWCLLNSYVRPPRTPPEKGGQTQLKAHFFLDSVNQRQLREPDFCRQKIAKMK